MTHWEREDAIRALRQEDLQVLKFRPGLCAGNPDLEALRCNAAAGDTVAAVSSSSTVGLSSLFVGVSRLWLAG